MVMKILLLILLVLCCNCTTNQIILDDRYEYHVVGVHETYPDAKFKKIKDAKKYVDKYKEFHDYNIVRVDTKSNIEVIEQYAKN